MCESRKLRQEAARLRDQAERLEAQAVAAEATVHEAYAARLATGLTREMVDLLMPDHGRTSCSDDNLANGWSSREGQPRCTRCALLDTLNTGFWPAEYELVVTLVRR